MRRISILISAAGTALLCGCQSSTNNADASSNGASVAASVPAAPAGGETVFIQTFPEAGFPTPDTTLHGHFAIERGCLTFVARAAAYRAVLPAGTRFGAPNAVLFPDGGRAALMSEIVVKGGEGEFGTASDVPDVCPDKAMLIGGLE